MWIGPVTCDKLTDFCGEGIGTASSLFAERSSFQRQPACLECFLEGDLGEGRLRNVVQNIL